MPEVKPRPSFSQILIRSRLWIVAGLSIAVVLFEFVEHPGSLFFHVDLMLAIELGLLLFLIGMVGWLLGTLGRAVADRDRAMGLLDVKYDLVLNLSTAKDWEEFRQRMFQFVEDSVGAHSIQLFMLDEASREFLFEAGWGEDQAVGQNITRPVLESDCTCAKGGPQTFIEQKNGLPEAGEHASGNIVHCLPIIYANNVKAVLRISLADAAQLSAEQLEILTTASVDIALVMEAFLQQRSRIVAEASSNARRAERISIAQDLHDTIGQNLCYLYMHLEQMAAEGGIKKTPQTRRELENLRDSANESYDMVRGALAILKLESPPHFVDLLRAQGLMAAERSGFELVFSSVGEPKSISPDAMRHAFFVYREALNNIQKHARAKHVRVKLSWEEDCLELVIEDDGDGFSTNLGDPQGHFGLQIMEERAKSFNGQLTIQSNIGLGTTVSFSIPYAS